MTASEEFRINESGPLPATALLPVTDGTASAVWEVTDANPNAISTVEFGVYVSFSFDPVADRIFVRFKEGTLTRGSTSVAVRTQ